MTVAEFKESLAGLSDSDVVPKELLLAALPWDLSYVESEIGKLEEIAELFGRQLDHDVQQLLSSIRDML